MANYSYSRQDFQYDVDICMLIDKTGSMRPIIDTVKQNALRLYGDIKAALDVKGKKVSHMRVRVIAFGDYKADGAEAFMGSDFLTIPEDSALLKQCVNGIEAEGGGDDPEDGLEALAFGIRSDWSTGNKKKRHIICMFTDAGTHSLGFGKATPGYPEDAPKNYEELTYMWGTHQYPGEMDPYAKRLLLFAPDTSYWSKIAQEWNCTALMPVASDKGLNDVTYQTIVDAIGNSV